MAVSIDDERFMRLALAQAERARGHTGDNPWVGAVIAKDGEVIGDGHTHPPGSDHAEIAAIKSALSRGASLEGATIYSTLEPCSFHGRTPACALAIVEHRIARVVIGMRDPHPRVNGEGLTILRGAGVEVIEGVLEPEVARSLAPWIDAYHPHAKR
ncbi:bifunctional diaminohydroxyphosphoribosylaminopyrimidine deaminase/5-amino-6-(5-phosphoribosylamino)uracil reductase RibD [Sandaracinus amylolyticus]|uniref:bifunctional diaminohydroxyphosphoribosylaminopyrimidine deaminase/5-amino-6-(5-phosphoribosylamino)uracil reductase RibD n=1 Tax=Sandaracinus amylolyticus TaxID=927083 RepID=UPI0023DDB4EC|nr:bifunctional diaminohydroxyphosphoribosylaminopyrimidine deaminase/5-amino-6-(5-phosphoribosylamino)uracil reductase RibD [Sandaracinus amylolyticus]